MALATAVAAALGTAISAPGTLTVVSRMVGETDRRVALARTQAATRAARIAGPGAGGALAHLAGFPGLALTVAVSFAVAALALLATRADLAPPSRPPASLRASVRQGLAYVLGRRSMRAVLVVGGIANMSLAMYTVCLPVVVHQYLGDNGALYGVLASVYQGSMLCWLALLSARRLGGRIPHTSGPVAAALLLLAGGFLLLAVARSPVTVAAAVVVTAAGLAATSTLADARLALGVPDALQGRAFASARSVIGALKPAGSAGAGALAHAASAALVMALAAGVAATVAVWTALTRGLDRDVPPEAPAGPRP